MNKISNVQFKYPPPEAGQANKFLIFQSPIGIWLWAIYLTLVIGNWSFSYAESLTKSILPNGLTVIVKENPNTSLVAISLFVNASQLDENVNTAGTANFVGQLILKGTKSRTADQIADEIESLGGGIGVSTSPDYTEVSLLTLDKHFSKGMEVLADVVLNPIFPKEEVEKERKLILTALNSRQDIPESWVYDLLLENLYGSHPYAWRETGKPAVISKIKRFELESFYRTNYQPQNMIVSIVGGIKSDKAIEIIKDVFKDAQKASLIRKTLPKPEKLFASRTKTEEKDVSAANLQIGFPASDIKSRDYPVLKVMHSLLGGGMTSRLFVNLREKQGLAYSLGAFFPTRREKSQFVVYATCDPKNVEKVKDGIFKELDQLKKQLVSKDELERHKNYLKGTFAIDHQSIIKQAWYLGWYETIGAGWGFDEQYRDLIDKVKAEDIRDAAQKHFQKYVEVVVTRKKRKLSK